MSIFTITNEIYRASFIDGPLDGELELRHGSQPAAWVGVYIDGDGVACYHCTGGHGIPGLVTWDYNYAYTILDD